LYCLEELNCSWCRNLINIPKIKILKKIDCSYTNISEIPETLECLEELNCLFCKNLKEFPKNKTLKKFGNIETNINEILKPLYHNKNIKISTTLLN